MDLSERIKIITGSIPADVNLVAVSKTRSIEEILKVYEADIRDFGENKVQELIEKHDNLMDKNIRWHLIGHLQRNKVKYIVDKVHLIHSLDSVRLLEEIEKQFSLKNKIAKVLIQINIGREESKSGILEEDLINLINEVEKCSYVKVKGLMTIIPKGDEESSRIYFKKMKSIYEDLKTKSYNNVKMTYLSMGMTNDYKVAIEEGANIIRVGEGIFGKRIYDI
ncbi:YggS family pyridoxal phosphate-dependent enzyme [Desnuesiella massiliensis]|uniref:YggS family pyridoxal phosphate-dependent enzyme n=1 Tax=Desnuesiella massiliensis TaxID=1650662 RepID=UPI0006E3B57B|nr:YggS family pyridoxal phosphate-dependent enzyme [Desnuesiella massiliensis]